MTGFDAYAYEAEPVLMTALCDRCLDAASARSFAEKKWGLDLE